MTLIVCVQCSDTAVIYFDDVRVPAKNIIGEEGEQFYHKNTADTFPMHGGVYKLGSYCISPGMGFTYQMMQFQEER